MRTSLEWHLVRRPTGWPSTDDVRLVEVRVRAPRAGELLVRNTVISVDPYMRGRMNEGPSYATPYELGQPMHGGAVGRVEQANAPHIVTGTYIRHGLGWRQWTIVPASEAERIDPDGDGVPPSAYLGALGMPGLTAWVGLYDIAAVRPAETIFISAASGAVGTMAGQLAKRAGLTVVGSAGSEAKVRMLRELGFDAAFDYTVGNVAELLADAAPDGIDCYFDNVGGEHLAAALTSIKPFGRIAACGMISTYNEPAPGPDNLSLLVSKKVSLRGFIVRDHAHRAPIFRRYVTPLLRGGQIVAAETRRRGIESAFDSLIEVLRGGRHIGKLVVDV